MSNNDLFQQVRARGQRLTTQRRLILNVLQQSEHHLSAEAIARAIAERHGGVSVDMATIYRNLRWLCDHGLVTETSLGQTHMVYVLLGQHSPHHHLVCDHCNAIIEIDSSIFDTVQQELLHRYGFQARMQHLAIFGICTYCQQAHEPSE